MQFISCVHGLINRIFVGSTEDASILLLSIGCASDAVRASEEVVPVRRPHPDTDGFSHNGVI